MKFSISKYVTIVYDKK